MKVDSLNTLPKKFSRQVKAYEAAGLSPDMEVQLPFAANADLFLNRQALIDAGIDPAGLARQIDQVLVENIGNNLSQKIKAAVAAKKPLPDQSIVDEMFAKYDFTGVRTTSEEGMSTEERTIISEIRKKLRWAISTAGYLANQKDETGAIIFNATRLQSIPESEGKKETPPNSIPVEDFEGMVAAAYQREVVEFSDGNGNTGTLDFSGEPVFDDQGRHANWPAIIEEARQEAARVIERNKTPAAPPKAMGIKIG
jgi:hypothetical protein